ncbi:efflux RND transporter permease subunit [Nannocystis radixulma]|uniref:Efflux RND transporter permease subunit n=1 Tax=Nannocystis radixulma TaxID=2995305 RepID=A0ABT5BA90_9BACT|nr:efflux RND transporter permease subunit [Nannocystis radixulma]MDC0671051.1 efflux RND transporter permease subunit [Nannocystis radixulma]
MEPVRPESGDLQLAARAREMERYRFTVTRPVAVLMVFLAVVVFGAFSIRLLPLNLMPDISYPRLTVRTEYPGAAPAEVENNVSRPMEEILGVVTGLTRIDSVSRGGYSDVILEFAWDTDMDEANQDVLEKIDAIKPTLPTEIKQPLLLRYDPTLDPVLTLSIHSPIGAAEDDAFAGTAGLKYLRRIADRDIRRLLEPLEGVAAVKVKGGLEEEIEVRLDEDQLRRTNINIDTVIKRLQAENINLAGGSMRDGRTRYLVRTVNEFRDLDDIRELVVVSRDGKDIKLRDLAEVRSGFKDRDVITRVDGREAVEIEVHKEADANIVDMAARVTEAVESRVQPRILKEYGAEVDILTDRSKFIESSIDEVRGTALSGGILAVIILFLFLRDVKTTLIVAISIPISVLVTFAPLNITGVSLNIMSLGGLALGIGMLVDNSIVVLESIHRCKEEGDDYIRATVRGVSEVGSAVISSTLTTVAVFFPMVFVEGIAGQMFGDLGLTVVFSLLASLAVALFLIPMLASRPFVGGPPNNQAPEVGFWRSLGRLWLGWESLRDLRRAIRPRWWWITLLPIVYGLLRFVLHFVFELLAKFFTALFLLFSFVAVRGVAVFGWLIRWPLWPVLWAFDALLRGLETGYPKLIRWSLRNRFVVYALTLASGAATLWAAPRLDTELIPELHQGEFTVEMSLPVGTPLLATNETTAPLERQLLASIPDLRTLITTIGSQRDSSESGERGEHTARLRVALGEKRAKPATPKESEGTGPEGPGDKGGSEGAGPKEQAAPAPPAKKIDPAAAEEAALAMIRPLVRGVPDAIVHVTRPVLFSFATPIEVQVRGYELGELGEATGKVRDELAGIADLRDVKSSILPGSPEVQIVYNRDALARLNLDIRSVAELVRNKVQGYEATKFNRKDRKIPVRVRLKDIDTATVRELQDLVVNPGQPRPVPLSAVAEITLGRGPNEIRRIGQQRVGLVTANLAGSGLGSAAREIDEKLAKLNLPAGVTTAVTGQSEEWETSSRSLYLALGLSIFLVYVIMASQFESLLYPLIILISIPLALVGVVWTLLLLGVPVSVLVILGLILLAGIVVNNAIVLVDYTGQLKERGHSTDDALALAGQVRLRPILMTTLTTVLGLVPMALGLGDGAELRTPMAITVIAGLSFSTLLTLIVIPTIYAGVDRMFGGGVPESREVTLLRETRAVTPEQLAPEVEVPKHD